MGKKVMIIGGGASGLVAGIQAAREGAEVAIWEHMDRVGKKLLSTGNGKCNMANLAMPKGAYRSHCPQFAQAVLNQVTVEDAISFFQDIGILAASRGGYVYPNSNQASSVLEALVLEARSLGVEFRCGCQVQAVSPKLQVQVSGLGPFHADAVVLATGSMAAPSTGSDGSGYGLARKLGHRVYKPLPALVQLRCGEKHYKQVSGVRTEAALELLANGKVMAADRGELQLTDYGISGIPVFQVSRYASVALDQGQQVTARIDFMPAMDSQKLEVFLMERRDRLGNRSPEEFMVGLLNKKLSNLVLRLGGISFLKKAGDMTDGQLKKLAYILKSYETKVVATNSYDQAQVCCGGVDTKEVDPGTMESRLVKGLYFAGELLDVDGICGGYNLQWAWSTGILAGRWSGRWPGTENCARKKRGSI